jgi:hypothetical protein
MSQPTRKAGLAPTRRRYLVHLFSAHDESNDACSYFARIRLWTTRINLRAETFERPFSDQCEFIETLNRLLPNGSDVRDVLSHIESPDGFLYLLHLGPEEAGRLGWRG